MPSRETAINITVIVIGRRMDRLEKNTILHIHLTIQDQVN